MGKENELYQYFEEALGLWRLYNFEYRTIVPDYNYHLDIKRGLGIRPINKLSQDDLKDFPKIPFLGISSDERAKEFLLDYCNRLDESSEDEPELDNSHKEPKEPTEKQKILRLKGLISDINNNYVDNALIANLRTRISDYKRQIAHRHVSMSKFGYDPDRCTSGNHTRQHKVLASSRF